jgi:hypothetical protein
MCIHWQHQREFTVLFPKLVFSSSVDNFTRATGKTIVSLRRLLAGCCIGDRKAQPTLASSESRNLALTRGFVWQDVCAYFNATAII